MDQDLQNVANHYAAVAAAVLDQVPQAAESSCPCCSDAGQEARMRGSEVGLYSKQVADALPQGAKAASRGCGDPVAMANLQPGETVLDLGSGGGIDALIASKLVGGAGHVYGVDMTAEMVQLASANATEAGCANVEFVQGRIEDIPLPPESVDVVISNCVINFASNKLRVLQEACRVLKPGGRLVVSDIVAFQPYPPEAEQALRAVTGCSNGMATVAEYEQLLHEAGFSQAAVQPKTIYTFPVLEQRMQRKGRPHLFEAVSAFPQADGACGSAIVSGVK